MISKEGDQEDLILADRLRLVVGRLARRLRQQSLGGLTPSQRSVLATLDRHGEMKMGRLAELEGISAPAATGIASRLAERGLVDRRPNPKDGRSAIVALTPRGRAVLDAGRRERTAFLARRLGGLTEDEKRQVARGIELLDGLLEVE